MRNRRVPGPPPDPAIGLGLLAGPANVVMQLAVPEVGHGVVESVVDSGQMFRHPLKRTRTTLTYLAVAMLGDDTDKRTYRRAVNRAHAPVRSDESSPVAYSAFDPELQLWVAACLYKGVEDTCRIFAGPLTTTELDALYEDSARFGTTLQVPAHMWPADRAAFEQYWNDRVGSISLDATVRTYLHDLLDLRFLPGPGRRPLAAVNRFVTTGFLPPAFRAEMRLKWSTADQRRFDRLMRVPARLVRVLPAPLRRFPFNLLLRDLRCRVATGRPLV